MYTRVIALLVAGSAVAAFVIALFFIQNSERTTQLSLDLGFMATQLSNPVPITWLLGGGFAVGFVIAGGLFGFRSARLSRRVRRLEQQVALGGGSESEWR